MALVKNPLMSVEAHGELAGVEFRTIHGRNVVGRRSIATNRATPAQMQQRSLLHLAHAAWSALSLTDQAAWSAIAPAPITGRNEYIARWIRNYLIMGDPPRPNPPPIPATLVTAFTYTGTDLLENAVLVSWEHDYAGELMLMFYELSTYNRQLTPTLGKFRYSCAGGIGNGNATITCKCRAPVVHILIKTIDNRDGKLIANQLYRFEPDWSE